MYENLTTTMSGNMFTVHVNVNSINSNIDIHTTSASQNVHNLPYRTYRWLLFTIYRIVY